MKRSLILLLMLPLFAHAQMDSSRLFVCSGLNYSKLAYDLGSIKSSGTQLSPVLGMYFVDKRKDIDDIQLTTISFKKDDNTTYQDISGIPEIVGGQLSTTASLAASYHKVIGLNKKSQSAFFFGIGPGVIGYFDYAKANPKNSEVFTTTNSEIGAVVSLKPVINYSISKRVFVGISSNLHIIDQFISFSRTENPAIPIRQQKTTGFEAQFFRNKEPNLQFMIGVQLM